MKKFRYFDSISAAVLVWILVSILSALPCFASDSLPTRDSVKPWAIWYWMQGAVGKEALTADLESMKQTGIEGAYLMPVKDIDSKYAPTVRQLSPEWDALVAHALKEADRLGLQIGVHICDGFALAGGPWITPELSMQKIVYADTSIVTSGRKIDLNLPRPKSFQDYYEDIRTFAYRIEETPLTSDDVPCRLSGINPRNSKSKEACSFVLSFDEAFSAKSLYVEPRGNSVQVYRMKIEASLDSVDFRTVRQLEPPRLGWQSLGSGLTFSLPPTTAKYFRFSWTPEGNEPGSEDLDAAKWDPSLAIKTIRLSSERLLENWEAKAALTWSLSGQDTGEEAIPKADFIDLSNYLQADRLKATLPSKGQWRIIRIGHTSTGQTNTTGGGGRGLECDKFSREAVRLQLDGWFGHIWNLVDSRIAKRTITRMHVDSWECGSQNWSKTFPEEFQKRRGYDLMPYLPVMTGLVMDDVATSEKVLLDIRETITELVRDVFYTELIERAHSLGCRLSAECTAPTMPGDGLLHYSRTDLPMGEFWYKSPTHDKPNDMADAVSGAHIYGRRIIQAEGFTQLRTMFDEDPNDYKSLLDLNYAAGFNALAIHVWVHNPWMDRSPGMTLDGIGSFFQRDQTWFSMANAFTDYIINCQQLLQSGTPVTDIAVFSGENIPRRSVLPNKLTSSLPGIIGDERLSQNKLRLASGGTQILEEPAGVKYTSGTYKAADWVNPLRGYSYDTFNPDVLRTAKVQNGKMVLESGAEYSVVIFPLPHSMDPGAAKHSQWLMDKIQELRDGACIVLCAESGLPYRDEDFSDLGLERDLDVLEGSASEIAWTHRRDGLRDIYFISSQSKNDGSFTLSLRAVAPQAYVYDPVRNCAKEVTDFETNGGRTNISLELKGGESCFVILSDKGESKLSSAEKLKIKSKENSEQAEELKTSGWDIKFVKTGVKVNAERPSDWTNSENERIKYYCGEAVYTSTFSFKGAEAESILLSLDFTSGMADVLVNGKPCGTVWTAPFCADITDAVIEGTNTIEIKYANTWYNAVFGASVGKAPFEGIWTSGRYWQLRKGGLVPSGILSQPIIKIVRR